MLPEKDAAPLAKGLFHVMPITCIYMYDDNNRRSYSCQEVISSSKVYTYN